MPANKKHLTASPWQRLLKITAAIIGGYLVTTSFMLCTLHFLDKKDVLITMKFMSYVIWVVLMILAFLAKSGWKIWAIYLSLCLLLLAPTIFEIVTK